MPLSATSFAAGPVVAVGQLAAQIGKDIMQAFVRWPSRIARRRGRVADIEQLKAEHIRRTLASAASIGDAAAKLGINPSTLYRKRKKHGIWREAKNWMSRETHKPCVWIANRMGS